LMMAVLAALASLGVAITAWLATLSVGDEVSFAGFKLTLSDDGAAVTERQRARSDHPTSSQLFAGQP
jgi:hypothetical protein